MQLIDIRLKNFLSFEELYHKFLNSPVLIKGKNLTEIESKETNGAGKSTIQAGIAYAILATPLRKSTLDRDLIRWGADEAHITLNIHCPIRKETLTIHRVLRQKGSSTLELMINQEEGSVKVATVNDGNSYILKWIGITSEDLKSFYILNKENYKSFIQSSNTDKLSFINRFIKAEQLEEADEVIKTKIKPLQSERQTLALEIATKEGKLTAYKEQLQEEIDKNSEEGLQSMIEELGIQAEQVVQQYDEFEKVIAEAEKSIFSYRINICKKSSIISILEKNVEDLRRIDFTEKYNKVSEGKDRALEESNALNISHKNVVQEISNYSSEEFKCDTLLKGAVTCPHCHTEFIPDNTEISLEEIRKNKAEIQLKIENAENTKSSIAMQIKSCNEKMKALQDSLQSIKSEESEVIMIIRKIQTKITKFINNKELSEANINTLLDRVSRSRQKQLELNARAEEIATAMEMIERGEVDRTKEEEIQGIINITEKGIAKQQKVLESIDEKISSYTQWIARFRDFRMSIAVDQLKIIQDFANMSLQRQKSELRLSIDGFKRNAKGEIKSEITVTVINGEGEYKSFWSFSGGERARIEMALIQAFQEMINGTNPYGGLHFLMIDEVLEGTDPLGLALLLESMNDCGYPVYIISHVMNIRAGVETLTVVKENGSSYIE